MRFAWLWLAVLPLAAQPQRIAIHAGRLLDVRTGKYLTGEAVLIEEDKIREIGPNAQILSHAPKGATVIDLAGATVLPGLIDAHAHLLDAVGTEDQPLLPWVAGMSPTRRVLFGARMAREDLEAALGGKLAPAGGAIAAPGMTLAHYAPRARLRLEAQTLETFEAGLDFGNVFGAGDAILDLSPKGDLTEAAANLFTYLREFDARGLEQVAVAPIPRRGLGEAINDRLRRAAQRNGT